VIRNRQPLSQTASAVIQRLMRARRDFGKEKDASAIPCASKKRQEISKANCFKERHSLASSTALRLHISGSDSVQDCSIYPSTSSRSILTVEPNAPDHNLEVSNSDQLLFSAWAIMKLETNTSFLSFRSSELSQSI
jgi:hypothetical protein